MVQARYNFLLFLNFLMHVLLDLILCENHCNMVSHTRDTIEDKYIYIYIALWRKGIQSLYSPWLSDNVILFLAICLLQLGNCVEIGLPMLFLVIGLSQVRKLNIIAELSYTCLLVIISEIHAGVFLNCSIWSMLNRWEIFPSLNGFLYWSVSQLSGYIPSYWQLVELIETNQLKLSTIAVQTEQISYLLLHGLNYQSFHFLLTLLSL